MLSFSSHYIMLSEESLNHSHLSKVFDQLLFHRNGVAQSRFLLLVWDPFCKQVWCLKKVIGTLPLSHGSWSFECGSWFGISQHVKLILMEPPLCNDLG